MAPSTQVVKAHKESKKPKEKASKRLRDDDSTDTARPKKRRELSSDALQKKYTSTPRQDPANSQQESLTENSTYKRPATSLSIKPSRDMSRKREKKSVSKSERSKETNNGHVLTSESQELVTPTATSSTLHAGLNPVTSSSSVIAGTNELPNFFDPGSAVTPDDILLLIRNMDMSLPSQERAHEIPRPASGSRPKKTTKAEKVGKNARLEVPPDVASQAHLLATTWYTPSELKELQEKGMQIRRGIFTKMEKQAVEAALDKYASTHKLLRAEVVELMFKKRKDAEHASFWTDIGKFLTWYQYYSDFPSRPWSKEEEGRLMKIMEKYDFGSQNVDDDLWWAAVVREMGGTRSRAQIRIKWLDCLNKKLKAGGPRRWLPIDHYILIHKQVILLCCVVLTYRRSRIVTLEVNDESEIVWSSLGDEGWNLWSGHELSKRWNAMKRSVIGYEDMPFYELLDILMAKKGSLSAKEIEAAIKMTQEANPSVETKEKRAVVSSEFVEDSDEEGD
ncbi:SubName: Full=Related to REB1-transcription factor {ECO:0000313/EMBL:CCA70677.1} [Serendipita indica DSM 11827]|nr:SubName: Full=Related to REB1-transcription factor {ECO:0000313/EMBL:CCA70677.1} [Serendipita indica DSM 11827]